MFRRQSIIALLFFCLLTTSFNRIAFASSDDLHQQQDVSSIDEHLRLGDESLIQDDIVTAIEHYGRGINHVNAVLSSESGPKNNDRINDDVLSTIVSLHTNLATAYSTQGENDRAIQSYRNAIKVYQKHAAIDQENYPQPYHDSQ